MTLNELLEQAAIDLRGAARMCQINADAHAPGTPNAWAVPDSAKMLHESYSRAAAKCIETAELIEGELQCDKTAC